MHMNESICYILNESFFLFTVVSFFSQVEIEMAKKIK